MKNNLSTLDKLKNLVKDKKGQMNKNAFNPFLNKYAEHIFDCFIELIDQVKEYDKEQERLIWKEGYIECCLDVADFFGVEKANSYPTEEEMKEIDEASFDYIKNKIEL